MWLQEIDRESGMVALENEVQVNTVWRFYTCEGGKWRWQRLTIHQVVVAESHASYKDYEACVAAAQKKGYASTASQPSRTRRELR